MRTRLVLALAILAAFAAKAAPDTNVFENPHPAVPQSELDRLVFAQWNDPPHQPFLCSDAVFVRRVFLDVLGTLPTANEARAFIEDPDTQNKRRLLIDQLLDRREFADYWAMKWADILRIKAEFPVNLWPNAAQAYHRWVRASLADNKPYDQFARELLTSSGSNFRVGPVNFYRAVQNRTPDGIARAVALAFMGSRAELWPTNRLADLSVFFSEIGYKPTSEWKEEHVFWDPWGSSLVPGDTAPGRASVAAIANPTNTAAVAPSSPRAKTRPSEALFPDGTRCKLPPDRDPRELFADWLITPQNPWFTRSIVNRVWAWLLGRGIIHEPDDIRDDNPPSNPALLAYLEKEMISGQYDLKKFYRLILNSQTYQLSSVPKPSSPEAAARFASYPLRRLEAEVLSDAINKVTGSSDLYTSPIPEPFTYIPRGVPAVAIADGSITSPFLALFGRSARATGMLNERNNKPTPAQWLYLLNSTDIQKKLDLGTNLQAVIGFGSKPANRVLDELYLTILSRFPTDEEKRIIRDYQETQPPRANTNQEPKTAEPSPDAAKLVSSGATNSSGTNVVAANEPQKRRSGPIGNLGRPRRQPGNAGPRKTRAEWLDVAWALMNSEEFLYRH